MTVLDELPAEIPLEFLEDLDMGIRGEFRSLCDEVIQAVAEARSFGTAGVFPDEWLYQNDQVEVYISVRQ